MIIKAKLIITLMLFFYGCLPVAGGGGGGGGSGGGDGDGNGPPPENNPPTSEDVEITIEINSTVFVQLFAIDLDGDRVIFEIVSGPNHGQAELSPEGAFEYTPDSGFVGTDMVTYFVTDLKDTSREYIITISVVESEHQPENNPPTSEDVEITIEINSTVFVQLFAIDLDGDRVIFEIVSGPNHGQAELSPEGAFEYTPDSGFVGTDMVTYFVTDLKDTSREYIITISVVESLNI